MPALITGIAVGDVDADPNPVRSIDRPLALVEIVPAA